MDIRPIGSMIAYDTNLLKLVDFTVMLTYHKLCSAAASLNEPHAPELQQLALNFLATLG